MGLRRQAGHGRRPVLPPQPRRCAGARLHRGHAVCAPAVDCQSAALLQPRQQHVPAAGVTADSQRQGAGQAGAVAATGPGHGRPVDCPIRVMILHLAIPGPTTSLARLTLRLDKVTDPLTFPLAIQDWNVNLRVKRKAVLSDKRPAAFRCPAPRPVPSVAAAPLAARSGLRAQWSARSGSPAMHRDFLASRRVTASSAPGQTRLDLEASLNPYCHGPAVTLKLGKLRLGHHSSDLQIAVTVTVSGP